MIHGYNKNYCDEKDLPLKTILHIKSMLIARACAEMPKKKPDAKYALLPIVI